MQQFSLFDQCVMLPYNNDVRERCLSFTCGDADLDDFFHNDAERYAEELMGKTYCWITEQKPHRIVALFTLANDNTKMLLETMDHIKILVNHEKCRKFLLSSRDICLFL